jgi:hypothetical protein
MPNDLAFLGGISFHENRRKGFASDEVRWVGLRFPILEYTWSREP